MIPLKSLTHPLSRLPVIGLLFTANIRRRLAVGHILTIGLCAIGIQTGEFVSSRRIEDPAQKRLEIAYSRLSRLSELQESFLDNDRLLLTYASRPELVSNYGYHLSNNAKQLQGLIDGIATDVSMLGEAERAHTEVGVGLSQLEINRFVQWCRRVGSNYDAKLTPLLEETATNRISQADIQSQLRAILSDYTVVELETCALRLENMIADTQDELSKAGDHLISAKEVEAQITQISLAVSLLGAIAIALLNSWAITRPLTKASQAAQQISRAEDFSLQIPVGAKDEVGVVAQSFNEVIQKVNRLLQEEQKNQQKLEYYNQMLSFNNQTLEDTVQQRTQALNQQNESLKETVQALQEAKAQLFQAEKMSSLGQLVAGIAHEINNPVNFIHGNLSHAESYFKELVQTVNLYEQCCAPPVEVQEKLEALDIDFLQKDALKLVQSMRMGTDRIRQIVLSLRNFSRLDEAEYKTVDIHEGIDSTLLILGHRLKANNGRGDIEIRKQYDLKRPVDCFPGQLNQVLMNILANAIDAMDEQAETQPNKTFEIAIATTELDNNFIQITIDDNGSGIPQPVRDKIFEPFFTTKEVGKGTGMGLSISYKIITERHRGKLMCHSTPEEGTTFIIELPIEARDEAESQLDTLI